ncbi:MAG TPA: hypothetical protein VHW90_10880 [Stellaceae bacterium]|jgi:hypothetical protein|nr:hypothetical protein [Stellaceae bacterium]
MADRTALNTLLVVAAAAPLVLTVADFVSAEGNLSLRAEIERRQMLVHEETQLAQLNQNVVRQIAVAMVRFHDSKLRELLTQHGVTINLPAANPPAAHPPAANAPAGGPATSGSVPNAGAALAPDAGRAD